MIIAPSHITVQLSDSHDAYSCRSCGASIGDPHWDDCDYVVRDVVWAVFAHGQFLGTFIKDVPVRWTPDECNGWMHEQCKSKLGPRSFQHKDGHLMPWPSDPPSPLPGMPMCLCPVMQVEFRHWVGPMRHAKDTPEGDD